MTSRAFVNKQKLNEYFDPRDFGAVADGVTDDTAAIQAAINALPADGGAVRLTGNYKCGALTFSATGHIELQLDGVLTLTTTLTLTQDTTLRGIAPKIRDQFGRGSLARINPPAGNIPTLRLTGSRNHIIEDIRIENHEGVGIELDGETTLGALCILRRVTCSAKPGTATALPLKVKTWFWLWVEGCSFYSWPGCAGHSILFTQDNITSGGYTGLCFVFDTILNSHGIGIKSSTDALMCPFEFRRIGYENCLTDGITIENTSGSFISHITLDDFELQDPINAVSLVKTIGPNIRGIKFENCDQNARTFAAGSSQVEGVFQETRRWFPYTFGTNNMPPLYTQDWVTHFTSAIDAPVTTTKLQPSVLPYTVLPVTQTVGSWVAESGAVITTGKRAPDGTLTAASIGGTTGGLVRVYDAAATITLNDWIIGGVWVRSTEADKPPNTALLLLSDATVRLNGINQTGSGSSGSFQFFGVKQDHARLNDNAWKWTSFAFKVTVAGTGTSNIRLTLYYDSAAGGISEWWMPSIIHIPASANVSDWDAVRLSRSLNAFPATGEAGTLALLNHQLLQLGGGVRHYSASAAPTTGTWKQGDVVWNTAPAAGGTPGWVCVTAGTPGTWKTMANVAA
jgi:hypothetical protein